MQKFNNIILTGRPASGKSELIYFLKKLPPEERLAKFHIGGITEIDDFLWIWELGEADDIWEKMGRVRLHTENVGHGYIFHKPELVYTKFMTLKMNRDLVKTYLPDANFYKTRTLFIEFARGGKDGYGYTLNHLDPEVLKRAAVLFLNNSCKECIRRNNARFRKRRKHSILAHKTPDADMEGIYRTNDWLELTGNAPGGYLNIKGVNVPFVTVVNEPEVTASKLLEERFRPQFERLWDYFASPQHSIG